MAWNGSRQESPATRRRGAAHAHTRVAKWCVVVAFAVFLTAVLLCLIRASSRETRVETGLTKDQEHRKIAEVKAQVPSPAKEQQPKPAPRPPQRVGEVRDGKLLMLSGELRAVKGVITSGVQTVSVAAKTFRQTANRRIASLLRVVPGEGILGSSDALFENFNEQFEESLKEEIVFEPEDTDEQRELKQAVLDVRKELLECRARGEDLSKVMADARNQLQELGAYRDELERQVERLRADGDFSEQDEDDLVRAANTMLEDRGVTPLELPSAIKHALELERLNEEGGSVYE